MASKRTKPNFEDEGFEEITPDDRYPIHEFESGDVMWGLLIDKKEVETDKGANMLFTVELDPKCKEYLNTNEDVLSFWGSQILNTRLKNVEPGTEEVVIEYLGKKKGKKFTYKNFRVLHKPLGDDFDIPDEE